MGRSGGPQGACGAASAGDTAWSPVGGAERAWPGARCLLALPGEAVVFLTSRFYVLLHLFQRRCGLGGTLWTTLFRRAGGGMEMLLGLVERCFRLHDGLCSSPLFGRPGGRDRLAEFMLHMEEGR